MARQSSAKAQGKRVSLGYRHSVTVVHQNGAMVTTVRAKDAIAVWSNKAQNGPTVRVDNSGPGIRFFDGKVVKSSLTL